MISKPSVRINTFSAKVIVKVFLEQWVQLMLVAVNVAGGTGEDVQRCEVECSHRFPPKMWTTCPQ